MELGKMLAHHSQRRGMSMAQLAREANVPKATLHGWVTGRRALNMRQLKSVASVLEVSLHELIFGTPDPHGSIGHELLKEIFSGDVRVSIQKIEKGMPRPL